MLRHLPAVAAPPETEGPSIVVAEVFGPTLQGEGVSLGLRAAFVRLGGCNLHCSWCDTPYTWDGERYDLRSELQRRSVDDIIDQVRGMSPTVVVVTGGEPLLWQPKPAWRVLIEGLAAIAPVEVETNGTQVPDGLLPVARYTVSPKLAHSGDPFNLRINPPALEAFAELASRGRAVLKFVVITEEDVRSAAFFASMFGFPPSAVYVMPEGTDAATLIARHRELAEAVLREGVNMTTRLHTFIWGEERAR